MHHLLYTKERNALCRSLLKAHNPRPHQRFCLIFRRAEDLIIPLLCHLRGNGGFFFFFLWFCFT